MAVGIVFVGLGFTAAISAIPGPVVGACYIVTARVRAVGEETLLLLLAEGGRVPGCRGPRHRRNPALNDLAPVDARCSRATEGSAMTDPRNRTAPATAPADVRSRLATRQDYRELLSAVQANGQALKAADLLAGRIDAKVAEIGVKVSAIDSRATGNERALLTLESKLPSRLATLGSRVSARIDDLDEKLIGRVEVLSSQVKANRESIRDLAGRFQATETAVTGLDARLERVEQALAAIATAVDAKTG